jgi:sulfatase-like protein
VSEEKTGIVRKLLATIARLLWGTSLVLTSIYCLLAFLPYTYFELIKSPAYEWMPWFARHQGLIYLAGLAGIFLADWPKKKSWSDFSVRAILLGYGLCLLDRPFLLSVEDNWAAYWWGLIALCPLIVSAGYGLARCWPTEGGRTSQPSLLPYSNAAWIGSSAAVSYLLGAIGHRYHDTHTAKFSWSGFQLAGWSLVSHALLAVIIFSIVNLILIAARRTKRPTTITVASVGLLEFSLLWIILGRFLDSAFSFRGGPAQAYAATLAMAVTLWTGFLILPLLRITGRGVQRSRRPILIGTAFSLSLVAAALPTIIGGSDWNGVLQSTFTLAFWVVLGWCVCAARPARAQYSAAAILGVVLLSGFVYKALQTTEIFWAKPLGSTDDEVSRAMEDYAAEDASFQLAHHILGNARGESCDDFCRILSEYTNVRDAEAKTDLRLVDDLTRTRGARPNIFIFVIDSMRPDYLGAYNPRVDFTPNLDAFARESVVVHNTYTQYAGTSLSEPTIWAGAMLLHAHYIEPFSKVDSLETLARVDGYHLMVSYDEVLSQLLMPSDKLTKLDTDLKLWNQLEVCSTIKQAEAKLDGGLAAQGPLLFYTQPKNVHQFSRNNLAMRTGQNWQTRDGFNDRVAYEVHQVDECLGGFFAYLKAHQLYDDSIIVVTSDHGDALGDFGRSSHSLIIYPEVMRVPLLIHLPPKMRNEMIYDDSHISALTDITPSLYYLLGHRPILRGPVVGHPLFVSTRDELAEYQRDELFMASDERAVYGLLAENGRLLYTTYASPAQSFLFDLSTDPNAQHNLLTSAAKPRYDEQIMDRLHTLADFYGYKPGVGSLLAAIH